MKIAVLGSGNGGCAVAADWALNGHKVRMFDFEEFPKNIRNINKEGGIRVKGDFEGFAKLDYAGHSIEEAIKDAEIIFAVGPAYSSEPFAKAVKDHINKNQVYIVCPGSLGGSLITKKVFMEREDLEGIIIGETSTLPYATRVVGVASLEVYLKLRGGMILSTIPSEKVDYVNNLLIKVYPEFTKSKNVLQTMLQNANPVIHPSVTILNAGLLERTGGDFLFYEEGVTPAVGKLIKAVDKERIEIGKALGVDIIADTDISLLQGYMTVNSYETGYSTAPGFKGIMAQSKLDHRYLNEDVGYGLVFMKDLATKVQVETPAIDAVIKIASIITEKDYMELAGRTLSSLGFSLEDIQNDNYK